VNTISTFTCTTETNAAGRYSIAGLPVGGEYIVIADKSGLAEAQSAPVTLAGGVTAQINVQLDVAAGATEITVKGTVG
jgi:carboxypeptidase family protein